MHPSLTRGQYDVYARLPASPECRPCVLAFSCPGTRQTLNAAGVHTIFYVAYLNYARQLYKLSRQQNISGESFAMAAQVLLDKWAARGCDPKVLAKIRTDVFDIAEPK